MALVQLRCTLYPCPRFALRIACAFCLQRSTAAVTAEDVWQIMILVVPLAVTTPDPFQLSLSLEEMDMPTLQVVIDRLKVNLCFVSLLRNATQVAKFLQIWQLVQLLDNIISLSGIESFSRCSRLVVKLSRDSMTIVRGDHQHCCCCKPEANSLLMGCCVT